LYRRERWLSPSGKTVMAALPQGAASHFGPGLKRFILSQYHQGQVTIPRLVTQLRDLGIDISKRQIVRLLSGKQDAFLAKRARCCARTLPPRPGSRLTIRVPGIRPRTVFASISATIASPGLQPGVRRPG
jgi:hypothetical protein